ncbi:MAG: peptidylprolyl isomerase [Firmicutes bacterium]|nr:peptidylprolyl isomerase [Bacillota bacterium]
MKRKLMLISAAALSLMLAMAGCSSNEGASQGTQTSAEETKAEAQSEETSVETITRAEGETEAEAPAEEEELIQLTGVQAGETVATVHTNMGDIKLRLFPQYAPKAVENFVTHAKEGYYDGITFHRVISEFMIQAGDPTGTGAGGESIWGTPFENEVTPALRNFRGALCMANAGADTNGSQFYIVQCTDIGDDLKSQLEQMREQKNEMFGSAVIDEYINNGGCPSLDFGYTVFGQVYEGMDVVDAISAVETDSSDKPKTDVIIDTIEVSEYGGETAAAQ